MRVRPLSQRSIETARGAIAAAIKSAMNDQGATAIEYTLIIALIVMALVLLIAQIGDFVSAPFQTVGRQAVMRAGDRRKAESF